MTAMTYDHIQTLKLTTADLASLDVSDLIGLPRQDFENRYAALVERMDPDVAECFDAASTLTDVELYKTVRSNEAVLTLTFDQLQSMDAGAIMEIDFARVVGLPRETFEKRYTALVERMDPDVAECFDAPSLLSDFSLYSTVRVNRAPQVLTFDEVEAMEEDAVMELGDVVLEGLDRDRFAAAYEANRGEDEPALDTMNDFDLYSSVRVNAYVAPADPKPTSIAPTL